MGEETLSENNLMIESINKLCTIIILHLFEADRASRQMLSASIDTFYIAFLFAFTTPSFKLTIQQLI